MDGVWTTARLVELGLSRSTVDRRCRSGQWQRVLPGVVVAGTPGFEQRCAAVALWSPRAVLSHRSAAHLWGLGEEPDLVEATVPRTANVRSPKWLTLHRRLLEPGAVVEHRGLRVVTRDRAVLDCQTVLVAEAAEQLVDAALAGDLGPRTLAAACARDSGVAGVVAARQQLRLAAIGIRSEAERRVGRALARRGWQLVANRSVLGWVGDVIDEKARVIVEIDGRELHSEPRTFRPRPPQTERDAGSRLVRAALRRVRRTR